MFASRDIGGDLFWFDMKTAAETALEFCRRCLVWPYAEISADLPHLVFEDMDPAVEAKAFDFTDLNGVMASAASVLPKGHTLNLQRRPNGVFVATVQNEMSNPPTVLTDRPAEDGDICVAIMEACLEAARKLREAY
jgi:hypothetical protein